MDIKDYPKLSLENWIDLTKDGQKLPVITKLNGKSMEPLIKSNRDIVTIIPPPDELKIGQIAVFMLNNDTCVAHRIYKINGDFVQTFGDNCTLPDIPVKKEKIVGILSEVKKEKRKINLNSNAQILYGKLWMLIFRKIRFKYHKLRGFCGRKIRMFFPNFHPHN